MSSAITNQETCLDGFSHNNDNKKVLKELEKSEKRVEKMCSNCHDIQNKLNRRNLMEEHNTPEWPKWLSAGDRNLKLLQSGIVTPNVVVAADDSGDYKTVAAAVEATSKKCKTRYAIRIKA